MYSVFNGHSVEASLHHMSSGEVYKVIIAVSVINCCRHQPLKPYRSFSVINKTGCPCDYVLLFKNAVAQYDLNACYLVLEMYLKGVDLVL